MDKAVKVALIIPAHNEERRIGKTLSAYSLYFEELRKNKVLDYEILIVINNTTDRTEDVVKRYRAKNKRIRYVNLKPGGKGFAVIEGFRDAIGKGCFDLIGFVDADMSTSAREFYNLVKNIKSFDGIIASRYVRGSIVNPRQTFQRIFASRLYNALIRSILLMPYRDTQCGAKLFKQRALKKIIPKLGMSQLAFDSEILYNLKKNYFRVLEFPTVWSDAAYSTVNFIKSGPWMALAIVRLRILNSPLRRFIRVYDKFVGFVPK